MSICCPYAYERNKGLLRNHDWGCMMSGLGVYDVRTGGVWCQGWGCMMSGFVSAKYGHIFQLFANFKHPSCIWPNLDSNPKIKIFDIPKVHNIITRTSEWVITLWRSCELFLYRDISWVRRTSEIFLPKTINMISTDDHHEVVIVFMPYHCWLDVDFNGLCV